MRAAQGVLVCCLAFVSLASAQEVVMKNVVERDGAYALAAGPNVDGLVYLRQERWPPDVIRTFHQIPWIDSASVRFRWAQLEPEDGRFDWSAFDAILAEVGKWNDAHPDSPRTLHIRPLGGVHTPKWFEDAGVRYYDTRHRMGPDRGSKPIRVPMPYDNPEFLKQLRDLYRAMVERYGDDPRVTVYHGTWSAGPWDEIFHPQDDHPLPPDYTPEKFVGGMLEQLDVLIEELCLKGKVAELPFSGKYPQKDQIDITGPIVDRIVERLGKRSPYLYIQSNGWGKTHRGQQTPSWGHERDINDAFGRVNLSFQALGTNAGGGWWPQGDWVPLVKLAQEYDVAYLELYPPDFMPLDTEHGIVEAFTQTEEEAGSGADGTVPGFVGFRPWLRKRGRTLHVREGTVRMAFASPGGVMRVAAVTVQAEEPTDTRVDYRVRTRTAGGEWSEWAPKGGLLDVPAGDETEVEAILHTDDGYFTPTLRRVDVAWQ